VLIKAVAGGGGKGMRKVGKAKEFTAALASAKREAAAAFGDDRVLLEMYVQRPRHIEVQVFGDTHGNIVHLFERDCSLQRRHQKVIEEAPAPGMNEAARRAVTDAAVLAAKAVNYVGAGTVEFIADASEGLRGDRIWFMEMNTRLQVEHPVTEEITGQDLVEWQLRVASGETLPLMQHELRMNGCAIEARLYAENVEAGFLPSTGALQVFDLPARIRCDAALGEGEQVTAFYDPMIAKLIAHAATRKQAAQDLAGAVRKVRVWPVKTNAGFLARCLSLPEFQAGAVHTGFIEEHLSALTKSAMVDSDILDAAAAGLVEANATAARSNSPWTQQVGFRLNAPACRRVWLRDASHQTHLAATSADDPNPDPPPAAILRDDRAIVFSNGEAYEFTLDTGERAEGEAAAGDGAILSPMPGKVVSVAAKTGARLKKGDPILVLEAMKMEHTLVAPFDGKLVDLKAKAGEQVVEGAVLARVNNA
jgi:acetyl/propionyl-CoA carboxylase alpha subunit